MKKSLTDSLYTSDKESPGLLFWRAFYNWQAHIRLALAPHEVTQGQYSVMAALSYLSSDGASVKQQDIAQALAMDKMMVSDLVKALLRKKYVSRVPHPSDARAYALAPTALGTKKLRICVPIVESIDETFFRAAGTNYTGLFQGLSILAKLNPVHEP